MIQHRYIMRALLSLALISSGAVAVNPLNTLNKGQQQKGKTKKATPANPSKKTGKPAPKAPAKKPEPKRTETKVEAKRPDSKMDAGQRNKASMDRLVDHLRANFTSINTIRANVVLAKPESEEAFAEWIFLLDQAVMASGQLLQTDWVSDFEVSVDKESNSVHSTFVLEGKRGTIELKFGASDCCRDCYPECDCARTREDGKCACGKPRPPTPPAPPRDAQEPEVGDAEEKCCGKPPVVVPGRDAQEAQAADDADAEEKCGCSKPRPPGSRDTQEPEAGDAEEKCCGKPPVVVPGRDAQEAQAADDADAEEKCGCNKPRPPGSRDAQDEEEESQD